MRAEDFVGELRKKAKERPPDEVLRFFHGGDGEIQALGLKFGTVFRLAIEFTDLPLTEINKLLDSQYYEVRMGAVAIMDFQARSKKAGEEKRRALFELYLRRHGRLNNWDFVDRGAPNIIGQYLIDKPRDILYELAQSHEVWERRTAIVATHAFIKRGELNDTFNIAKILLKDKHEFINKAVGSWIREAGKRDPGRLKKFLDQHIEMIPRITLRYAIEKFDPATKRHYLNLMK